MNNWLGILVRNYFLLIALTLFSAHASAEWEMVDNQDDLKTYIDTSTIRNQGAYTMIWVLSDYNGAQKIDKKKFRSTKTLYAYNCQGQTKGFKAFISYELQMGLGQIVDNESVELALVEFRDVVPGSIGETIFNITCALK